MMAFEPDMGSVRSWIVLRALWRDVAAKKLHCRRMSGIFVMIRERRLLGSCQFHCAAHCIIHNKRDVFCLVFTIAIRQSAVTGGLLVADVVNLEPYGYGVVEEG